MAKSTRREFLMLAHKYDPAKHDVSGCYISEKLDGTRCFWDGGISRGMATEQVPWANVTDPKTGLRKKKIKPVSTGLWSRYGNPIMAPDWWINQLPCMPLDGELWAGRGGFQLCRSICAKDLPSTDWEQIEFAVIGSPPFESIFGDGVINNPNMRMGVSLEEIRKWLSARPTSLLQDYRFLPRDTTFEEELAVLREAVPSEGGLVYLLRQRKLPSESADAANRVVEYELDKALDAGGEGVVIRASTSIWTPVRSHAILKYKPYFDDEGTLVGYTSGRKTDLGSKLLGYVGALILDYNGHRLELAGLNMGERAFTTPEARKWASDNPGKDMPPWTEVEGFKKGQPITFKYRELSDDGIPKDARYFRQS